MRAVDGAAAVFLRILGRKRAETKWRMECFSDDISEDKISFVQNYLSDVQDSLILMKIIR